MIKLNYTHNFLINDKIETIFLYFVITKMSFLNIVDPSSECINFPNDLAHNFPFPLDKFQEHAIKAIHANENILVTCRTGSGKTVCAEYQIYHSLKKGKRVFYTTPIKSLSNQKFYDLKKMFGEKSVGILTGDIKFNPNADIVIMTTEILRNLLYKKDSATENVGLSASLSLDNLDAVIFDEVHYINNKERGGVWEECLIMLPKEINLVLLSATIDSADLFASWLASLKQKPIHLISTTYRIVPLEHYVLKNDEFLTLMDAKENFYPDTYMRWLEWLEGKEKNHVQQKKQVAQRRIGGYTDSVVKKDDKPVSFLHTMVKTIQMFVEKEMLPALFFVFSRKGCEDYASKVSNDLVTNSETADIKHIIKFHLNRYKDSLQVSEQYFQLTNLLEKGVAYHHSGLLPMLKEIVEILFTKGLVKVLFATETFAVGLNLPTKTVVFTSYRKYEDDINGLRMLNTDEYIQMAGRAGRRGKDIRGYVFYLPDRKPEGTLDIKKMMTGSKTKLQSRLKFEYDFILKTVQSKNLDWVDLVQKSYYNEQIKRTIQNISEERIKYQASLDAMAITQEQLEICKTDAMYKDSVAISTNASKRKMQAEYDAWKATHQVIAAYKEYEHLQNTLADIDSDLAYYNTFQGNVEPYFAVLKELNYMDENTVLTKKGINATEFNEANSLLLSEMYEHLTDFNQQEILMILSCFMDSEEEPKILANLQIPKNLKDLLKTTEIYCKRIEEVERVHKISFKPWTLNYEYIEMLHDLFNGASIGTVCDTYQIFEGNLTRFLLKLLNIVDELKNVASLNKNVTLLEKLEDVRAYDFYKIAIPESLYLYI